MSPTDSTEPAAAAGESHVVRALLVEDDDVDAKLIGIHAAGMREPRLSLTRAVSADAGRRLAAEQVFDLCILDFWLGCETSLRLLADLSEAPLQLPSVVLTSLSTPDIGELCRSAGAKQFIGKERLDTSSLRRAVLHVLALRAPDESGEDAARTLELDSIHDLLATAVSGVPTHAQAVEFFNRRSTARDRLARMATMSEIARLALFERLVAAQADRRRQAIVLSTFDAVVGHAFEIAGATLASRGQVLGSVEGGVSVAIGDPAPLLFLVHEFVCRGSSQAASDTVIEASILREAGGLCIRLQGHSTSVFETVAFGPLFEHVLTDLGGRVKVTRTSGVSPTFDARLCLARIGSAGLH